MKCSKCGHELHDDEIIKLVNEEIVCPRCYEQIQIALQEIKNKMK